jgi:hypothetical protein
MRVYVSVDMEGVAGVVHEDQTDPVDRRHAGEYNRFPRPMLGEANADGQTGTWADGQTGGRADGQTGRRSDGRMGRWADGQMVERSKWSERGSKGPGFEGRADRGQR